MLTPFTLPRKATYSVRHKKSKLFMNRTEKNAVCLLFTAQ